MLKRISQTQQRLKVGSHGEDYGSWMSNPVFYLFGGLTLIAAALAALSFAVFHLTVLGVLFVAAVAVLLAVLGFILLVVLNPGASLEGMKAMMTTGFASMDKTLGEALLAPTKIYVKPVLAVMKEVTVKGVSHITGGGFYENIPRSLKAGCCAVIKKSDVRTPVLFDVLAKEGNIPERDMFNTFNMGVGMILTVAAEDADKAIEILKANGEDAYRLGVIGEGSGVQLV